MYITTKISYMLQICCLYNVICSIMQVLKSNSIIKNIFGTVIYHLLQNDFDYKRYITLFTKKTLLKSYF